MPQMSGHILVFYNSKSYVSDGCYKYLLHPYTLLLHWPEPWQGCVSEIDIER